MKPKIINRIKEEDREKLNILESVEECRWDALSKKLISVVNSASGEDIVSSVDAIYISGTSVLADDHAPFVTFIFDSQDYITFDMFEPIDSSISGLSCPSCAIMYYTYLFDKNEHYAYELNNAGSRFGS